MNVPDVEGLNLPIANEFTLPNYAGGSIANVPATVAQMLGVQLEGLPALPSAMWEPLGEVKRVVLLTLDGFGWNLIQARQDLVTAVSQRATNSPPFFPPPQSLRSAACGLVLPRHSTGWWG